MSPTVSASTGTSPVWPDLARPYDPIAGAAPRGVGNSSAAPAGQPTTSTNTNDASTTDLAEIVVLRGDTLWAIAARSLGPGATTAQIAREWPRWWAANEHVIGPDPDKILPGQRLQPPRPGP
ncbi:LysM peptidoglycan-binding domain-containing protein [Frankia sp. CiP3]|uniref:LysM peptidoglycan-binding domain-containing protein n=1 Tax=Frankia sp. CiP3 TaxID=2880971 RepID=UPI001EF45CC9|nr:LysM peptidoglycan-binding domain-containing protein [Frankia sp. CiP3]